jgi:sialic acid synthase SpsE
LLGAKIFEKHFMISKNSKCVDNPVSIYPTLFKKLKNELNNIPLILSKPKFGIRPEEKGTIKFKRNKIL